MYRDASEIGQVATNLGNSANRLRLVEPSQRKQFEREIKGMLVHFRKRTIDKNRLDDRSLYFQIGVRKFLAFYLEDYSPLLLHIYTRFFEKKPKSHYLEGLGQPVGMYRGVIYFEIGSNSLHRGIHIRDVVQHRLEGDSRSLLQDQTFVGKLLEREMSLRTRLQLMLDAAARTLTTTDSSFSTSLLTGLIEALSDYSALGLDSMFNRDYVEMKMCGLCRTPDTRCVAEMVTGLLMEPTAFAPFLTEVHLGLLRAAGTAIRNPEGRSTALTQFRKHAGFLTATDVTTMGLWEEAAAERALRQYLVHYATFHQVLRESSAIQDALDLSRIRFSEANGALCRLLSTARNPRLLSELAEFVTRCNVYNECHRRLKTRAILLLRHLLDRFGLDPTSTTIREMMNYSASKGEST